MVHTRGPSKVQLPDEDATIIKIEAPISCNLGDLSIDKVHAQQFVTLVPTKPAIDTKLSNGGLNAKARACFDCVNCNLCLRSLWLAPGNSLRWARRK